MIGRSWDKWGGRRVESEAPYKLYNKFHKFLKFKFPGRQGEREIEYEMGRN